MPAALPSRDGCGDKQQMVQGRRLVILNKFYLDTLVGGRSRTELLMYEDIALSYLPGPKKSDILNLTVRSPWLMLFLSSQFAKLRLNQCPSRISDSSMKM